MSISEHTEHFAGKAVEDYAPETGIEDPVGKIYRLSIGYDSDEGIIDQFAAFLKDPRVSEILGIVIGLWDDAYENANQTIVEALVAARDKKPGSSTATRQIQSWGGKKRYGSVSCFIAVQN